MTTTTVKVVGPRDGKAGFLGSIGVRLMIEGPEAGDRFSLVEHPMSPRALAVLATGCSTSMAGQPMAGTGSMTATSATPASALRTALNALLGEHVVVAGPGDLVFKPRNQWHTFWNAGDEPARILEIISPAGFERYFEELVDLGGVSQAGPETLAELCARYQLEMDPDSVPGLVERFGLRFPGEPI